MLVIAELMRDALRNSTPVERLQHMPFSENVADSRLKVAVSVARCARISYFNTDGDIPVAKDVELFEKLINGKHYSPFEHVGIVPFAAARNAHRGNFDEPWCQLRHTEIGRAHV